MSKADQQAKWREQQDRYLEQRGLLNYQTKGMSQSDVAGKYQQAGVQVQDKWFNQNYGGRPQTPMQGGYLPPSSPTNATGAGSVRMLRGNGQSGVTLQGPVRESAISTSNIKTGWGTFAGQINTPMDPMRKSILQYSMNNGLLVKESVKPTNGTMNLSGTGIATVQDALNGQANWSDVEVSQRQNILADPKFYETNQITQYPKWMQQQILADPAFDWKKLPKWQETYYKVSSSPAGMGAAQGALMGLAGGGAGSAAGAGLGAGLGWAAAKSGYDQSKEAWQQTNIASKAFGWMNFLAEQTEKIVGVGVQTVGAITDNDPNTNVADVFTKEGWNAGATTFETLGPAVQSAVKWDGKLDWDDALRIVPAAFWAERMWNVATNPEQFKGEELYLGANVPEPLKQSWNERMTEARERIKGGENYREVMTDFQTGIVGQMSDMAGQAFMDPLNVMPKVETRILGKVADITGNKVAAEAFKGADAPIEAAQRYKNLVQTGEALKINPDFKVDEMGMLSRFAAGVTKDGQIKTGLFGKGLLEPVTGNEWNASNPIELVTKAIKDPRGFIDNMTSLTPQSRAQMGAGMFYENIGALLTRFDDPHEAGKYLKALSNSDMETWKELGSRFADSPEFYTVLPALKDFNGSSLDGIIQTWDMSQANRDMLTRVSDVLGEQPGRLLDDLATRGTAKQDFQRITQRLEQSTDPKAKLMLDEIAAGRFTADTLKQIVDIYTGDGALAWHPNQIKAQMLDALGSHFDEWVSKRMMLDQTPEAKSAFFRTAALMKQAQSILLLGMSPGYAIQNGLSNMVHRAATGIYGYMTPKQINGWMDKFGATPARFEEGVGIGGIVEQAGNSKVHAEAQTKAVKGKGVLTDAKQKLGKLSSGMPMSKLSSWFEKSESKQAFAIGMKQFWNQSWRRGTGFKAMSPELVGAIKSMGIQPERIYAAIEAGLNQADIEKVLYGRFEGVQSRSLVDEAAQKAGLTSSQAADMLDKLGVLDSLDLYLKGQTTSDGVSAAFKRAERVAQDHLDMQVAEDLKAQAEHVKQKVAVEQPSAAFDVIQDANVKFTEAWMEHYYDLGEVMSDLYLIDDGALKSKAIDQAYEMSGKRFDRVDAMNAANYKGIFDAWGKSGHPDTLGALSSFGESHRVMADAYTEMRQINKGIREKHRGDIGSSEFFDDLADGRKQIDKIFDRAFKAKHDAEMKAGVHLGNIFESLYGKAAGEAARSWWEDVVKFNDEIVAREKKARAEFEGMPKEQREAAKQKYYAETKILAIAEAQKINEAGIARLERVVKGGGDAAGSKTQPSTPPPAPPQVSTLGEGSVPTLPPTEGSVPTRPAKTAKPTHAEEVNALIAQAEQRVAVDAKVQADRVASVWDVAEGYGRQSLPYDRTILQDRFALIAALRKTEYGGMADLTGLNDPRLTPEFVRDVMERRQAAKVEDAQVAFSKTMTKVEDAVKSAKGPRIGDNTTILRAIAELGGIKLELARDLTGEKRPKTVPGMFTRKGFGIDEMARMLAEEGYPIDVNDVNDPGGIGQTTALIERARRGDKVFPVGHDYESSLARAQDEAAAKAFGEAFDYEAVQEVPFDSALWQRDFENAVQAADLTAVYERIGELPEEFSNQLSVNGVETWGDYVSRVSDDVVAKVEADARDTSIAEAMTRADDALFAGEVRGEYAETRTMMKEKFAEAFDLTDEQATAYMELSDALSGWYERKTGENGDAFYSRYYNDVREGTQADVQTGDGLEQQDNVNRRMSQQEIDQYARALVREGSAELRRAVRNENVKADRVALLNAAHKLNPEMAVSVAKQTTDVLFQDGKFGTSTAAGMHPLSAKGMVTFDETGIKATIHAFEAADFSTLVHENGHVFRRVLSDVAERTGNVEVKADLTTIEEWAGVKDGVWERSHEEKFARGFERYLTEGNAPTPKLARAFESFKNWMLEIYRTITGSAIDVKLTDEVRSVFDRMLGDETSRGAEVAEGQRVNGESVIVGEEVALYQDSQLSMFGDVVDVVDEGQAGGMLPGMREATGMLFDVQPGSGTLRKMEAPNARSVTDIVAGKSHADTRGMIQAGDIVKDKNGNQYSVKGVNEIGKLVTEDGKVLEPLKVERVASQANMFDTSTTARADPVKVQENLARVQRGLNDFGEKLGGARKDKVQTFVERQVTDADLAKMSLSEIWRKAEVDAIEDVNQAALATALRDSLPSKPRDSYKLKRWVEKVKAVRSLMEIANTKGVPAVLEQMRANSVLRDFAEKVILTQQLPRETWGRIGEVTNYPDAYKYVDGKKVPSSWASAQVDGKRITTDNMNELLTKVKEALGTKDAPTSTMKFEIRGNGKEFFINKEGDPLYRKLKTFDSPEEARKFMRENREDLTRAWEDVKARDNVKETDVRREENRPRTAEDYRQGKDATPEMFTESFGFRGVEFGNWVSQGANIKERQGMLNAAYDALYDLSDIVGVPPKAIALDGTLGLGLGSRGSGSASAHFEPTAIVINLTKTRGAGTLAHEWFHALDNYFQRKRGTDIGRENQYITYKPETMYQNASGQTITKTRYEQVKSRLNVDDWKPVEGVRPEVEQRFTELVKALDESPMKKRVELIDKGQGGYWSRTIERAARSFENYVIHEMMKKGYDNDYLANVKTVAEYEAMGRDTSRYPYLMDKEIAPVAEAFDNLFKTVETRETARGTELYQMADPNEIFKDNVQPVGALDSASQFLPHSEVMDEGWSKNVKPLLKAMEEGAIRQLGDKPLDGAVRDMSPEGQKMLRQYMSGVKNDMATSKLAAMRWGEQRRDFAMLNYSKRYGFDRWMDVVYPYQFFYSRSLATWAARALDKPAWFANYARLRNQQSRYERDIPERLRGKIQIPAPWMPDWMGDSLYIDPLANLFTPANFLRPFERIEQDNNYQVIVAEQILQEWAAEGTMPEAQIQEAVTNRSGTAWERALAEAKIRRESEIANPADFFSTMFGPAWYLSTPLNALGIKVPGVSKGDPNKVGMTPIANTTRAIEAVSQGTWAEPYGKLIGMLGKPEEWARKKAGLPTLGEYGEYYTKRQLTNMVAEGLIDSEQAQMAMIEKQGPLWEDATQRVKLELAMRVPTMGALYAGLHGENFGEGMKGLGQAALPTLFGSGLLPAGELEFRGLKQEWNEVWKKYDAGDTTAVTEFFDEHPEYEAYLAKNKSDDELMQSFLVGKVWDGYSELKSQVWEKYMALGKTNQKQVNAELGDLWQDSFMNKETRDYAAIPLGTLLEWNSILSGGGDVPDIENGEIFGQAFLNKETRSYESISTDTLIEWARALNRAVPQSQNGKPLDASTAPINTQTVPGVDLYDPSVTRITDEFFGQRTTKFPDYYEVQAGYYNLPKSERAGYLRQHPDLKQYWDWKSEWYDTYPDLVPVMNGQVFKRVDTQGWPPMLEQYVAGYAYSGDKMPEGARKALEQQWIVAGRPNDDVDTWINSVVVPSMLYGGE